jgi:hypothetical protein
MFKTLYNKRMSLQPEISQTETRCRGRPKNAGNITNYHWRIYEKENDKTYCFVNLKDVTERYGLHRATANLMAKNPDKKPRLYRHIQVEKIKIHKHLIPEDQKLN